MISIKCLDDKHAPQITRLDEKNDTYARVARLRERKALKL